MHDERIVFVVDDDPELRSSVCALVASMGYRSESYASAEEFLEARDTTKRGILVADVRMPGMSGLDLQSHLSRQEVPLPIIVLTAFARTRDTVQAMKGGALTMIDKPYQATDLEHAIRDAMAAEAVGWEQRRQQAANLARLAELTPDERDVLDLMILGSPNKVMARKLGISVRTVEKRRHRIQLKTGVDSLAQLVRLVMETAPKQ